jgi:hypothetical protein
MKKGYLLWTLIILLVLGFIVWWLSAIIFGGMNEEVKASSRLEADRMAGIVNMLKISPPGTSQTITVTGTCQIFISQTGVTYKKSDKDIYFSSFVQSDVKIIELALPIACTKSGTSITFSKEKCPEDQCTLQPAEIITVTERDVS